MTHYRIKDVPNRKKLSYIFTYYKWHMFAVVFAVTVVGYLIHATWIAAKTDVSVLWLSKDYSFVADTVVRERFESIPWDIEDNKNIVAVQHVQFSDNYQSIPADTKILLLTLLSSGDFDVLMLNEPALVWANEQQLIGTWSDLYGNKNDMNSNQLIIPCDKLKFFENSEISFSENMYLTIAKPPSKEKQLIKYRKHMDGVQKLLEWRG